MRERKIDQTLFDKDRDRDMMDKKATNTAFIMMFPALILAAIGVFYAPMLISVIGIALAIYQFLMLKKFIEDYYKR